MDIAWYIPPLIFAARICDVSLGTFRMVLVIANHRYLAALLGFFEVCIWALAVGGVIKFLDNPIALVSYAGGFAAGTLVGMIIEDRVALGYRVVQVITRDASANAAGNLRARGYQVTRLEGSGREGPVEIAYTVIRRRRLREVLSVISETCPDAFVTVERADRPKGGAFGPSATTNKWRRRAPVAPASLRK
ncbi:MAG: DUF2179 domain-containing protein [Phycisphaerales bacterium]